MDNAENRRLDAIEKRLADLEVHTKIKTAKAKPAKAKSSKK